MQFLVLGYDGKDDDALDRRLAVRKQHLAVGDRLAADGTLLFAAAILDANARMIGSMLVLDFPSRVELDAWLDVEPYVTGDVWRQVEISPVRVGRSVIGASR